VSSTAKQQLSRNPQNAGYSNPIKTYPVPAVTNEDGTISVPAQPVYGIDPNHEPIDMYLATRGIPGGTITSQSDGGNIGAAGRTLTVPAGRRWKIMQVSSDTTMTATVGNRLLTVRIANPAGQVLWSGALSAAVTAAQIGGYDVGFGSPLNVPSTAVRRALVAAANTNVQVRENTSITEMLENWTVTILDTAAIDVADQVLWRFAYVEYVN
jgi:hypothetical protein